MSDTMDHMRRDYMRSYEELREALAIKYSGKELELLDKALNFAAKRHKGQVRADGSPYITHPIEVAKILAQLNMELPVIIAALLHDVLEDTPTTLEEIKESFGEEVAKLVFGVTKITSISKLASDTLDQPRLTKREVQLRNLRRLLLTTVEDIRALILKLADRLHNMRTLEHLPPEKRKRKALETLRIYVPLAHRLGMWVIKSELEDLSFRYAYPEEYNLLSTKIKEKLKDIDPIIKEFRESLENLLGKANIRAEVSYRVKTAYSIFDKMQRKGLSFDEIYDLLAFRVIVNSLEECYTLLGLIHQSWIPLPNRIKDYIAKPKPNGYRSLHTTVLFKSVPIEVQIRTWEMHREAEWGVASHWVYKHGEDEKFQAILKKYQSQLSNLLESLNEAIRTAEEEVIDELQQSVYVFTPRGECIELPNGSTPIDFAYRIHTEVGNHCVGAKVNGRIVPLSYQLQNGDVVEIITSKSASPSLDWLSIVRTRLARSKIKSYFKKKNKELYVKRAKELIEKELKGRGYSLPATLDEALNEVFQKYYRKSFSKLEDMVVALGSGELHPQSVVDKIARIYSLSQPQRLSPLKTASPTPIPKGLMIKFAKCCSPLRGDDIVGLITIGKGLSIHRRDCRNLRALLKLKPELKERLIEVSWDELEVSVSKARLSIRALDRKGLLRDIMEVISGEGVNVTSLRGDASNGEAKIILELEVSSAEQLDRIVNLLRRERPEIRSIRRI